MTDPTVPNPVQDAGPNTFADLPIQPTGSGVADLEIAYEQMKLSREADAPVVGQDTGTTREHDAMTVPTETGADAVESAAHPS